MNPAELARLDQVENEARQALSRAGASHGPIGPAGGSLGGTYPNPTVVQFDGAGGIAPIVASQVHTATGTNHEVIDDSAHFASPDGAPHVAYTEPAPAAATAYDYIITALGVLANGDAYRADFFFSAQRIAAAAESLIGAAPLALNVRTNGGGGAYSATVTQTGANGASQVNVTGVAGVEWTVEFHRVQASA
jgi:hypothetical protein